MMTDLRSLARLLAASLVFVLVAAGTSAAQTALARARTLYNQQKYDEAIAAAAEARKQGGTAVADEAALVSGRARLERYRRTADPIDLSAAREALQSIRPAQLSARDRADLLIGFGQALFFANEFGASAELFEVAWGRADLLPQEGRNRLLDWWGSAVDRQAQQHPPAERIPYYRRLLDRAFAEAQHDPTSAPPAYWAAVAARGTGDLERATDTVLAAWVRSRGMGDSGASLRGDLDRLMLEGLIPERARQASGGRDGQQEALASLTAEWQLFKQHWP